jgi:hypothetical protein
MTAVRERGQGRSWPARVAALAALAGCTGSLATVVAVSSQGRLARASAAEPAERGGGDAGRRTRLEIAWGGDTTLGSSHGLPPDRGWPLLAPVAGLLRGADLAALNLEGTFSVGGQSKCAGAPRPTCFAFQAPPENAATLPRAGVDLVNLANNHAFDFGPSGLAQTEAALRAQRVAVAGRPGQIAVRRVRGVRVAAVGFSTYPWTAPLRDLAAVRGLVRAAAARADVVLAFLHAGAEGVGREHTPVGGEWYLGEDRGDVRAFAHAAVDAGADLVLGSGPHVLRGLERHRGRLIAYSLGNLAGFHTFGTQGTLGVSAVLRVRVDGRGRLLGGHLTSLVLDGTGIPHLDPSGRAAHLVSALGRDDFGSRAVRVGPDGRLAPLRLRTGAPGRAARDELEG